MTTSRRRFATVVAGAGAALFCERWLGAQALRPIRDGRLLGTLPLGRFDGRPQPALHTLLGSGLDARQFTDLSSLDADRLVTPVDQFYVRTAHAPSLPPAATWTLTCGGLVTREQRVDLPMLARESREMGAHVMECAGNSDPANFGLLSAASWTGVPVVALLDRVSPQRTASRLRVTGFDDERTASVTSNPGASWVFTRGELERTGAFLALQMNGTALTADHGAPVRLVVPNYYGCSCIKWVTRIDWVTEDEPASSQMREFSARTHQAGVPAAARDYAPPVIELAAMPVRVEQWLVTGDGGERVQYRVVGVRWGVGANVTPLSIRFRHDEPFVPVSDCQPAASATTWSLWSHTWAPDAPGRYQIALNVADPAVPARRLGLYYYTREVEITRAS